MKRNTFLLVCLLSVSCSIPKLSRSPLDFFAFLRIFTGTQFTGQTIGGVVSGLIANTSVTLTNGNDTITVSTDGNFTFPRKLNTGDLYNVNVTTNGVGLSCTIANAQGVVQNAPITNISITCGLGVGYYEVGVNITGITGTVDVQNNGADTISFSANGFQKFSIVQPTGSNYSVTISSQPAGTVCSFDNPSLTVGTVGATNVTVFITCVSGYIVGGNLFSFSSTDIGTSLINQKSYLRTFAGSFPTNNSGLGPAPGVAVMSTTSTVARFNNPSMMAADTNFLYVADTTNGVIRKIDKVSGITTIFAGGNSGGGTPCPGTLITNCLDGVGTAAQFNGPVGLTTNGNNLFVLETNGNRIRIVNLTTTSVSTLAGSGNNGSLDNTSGILASFSNPSWMTLHNGTFYIVDRGNCTIRTLNPTTTAVATIAGGVGLCSFANSPVGTNARFVSPIAIVGVGNYLYVSDVGAGGGYKIRRISLTGTNAVDTIAGDGVQASTDGIGTSAQFNDPHGLTTDGTNLFISEWLGHRIRHLNLTTNRVTTLVGSVSGYADNATGNGLLNFPGYIATDGQTIYIADQGNHAIRTLQPAELLQYTLDGNANDSIGTNHGNLIGAPNTTRDENGLSNGAYEMDGTTQSIVSSSNVSQITDNLTISAWIHTSGKTTNQAVFYNGLGGTDGYGLVIESSGNLRISVGNLFSPASFMQVSPNRWTHVTMRRFAGSWQIFFNGKSDFIGYATNPITPTGTFKVGDDGNGSRFKGKISNVQFFNGALDDDAIQKLAIQVPSGLISYYPFNGNGKDFGNYSNDLSSFGVVATTTDRNGFPSSAYYFNGTSYFEKSNPNGLLIGGSSRSICAWFKSSSPVAQYIVSFGTAINSTASGLVILQPEVGMLGWNDEAKVIKEDFLNQWIHLCGVFDGTTAFVYENGTLRHSEGKSSWNTGISSTLNIGRLITPTGYFNGDIDDVRIYDRSLSISEIRAISGYYPTQTSVWNQTVASSSLKFFLLPESANFGAGGCNGGANCVYAWNDRSRNNLNLTQATASAQPIFNANILNGSPGIRFIGPDATYLSAACSTSLLSSANTIFVVYNDTEMSGSDGIFQNGAKLLYLPDGTPPNKLVSLFDLQLGNPPKVITSSTFSSTLGETILLTLDHNGTTGNIYKYGTSVAVTPSSGTAYNCALGDLSMGRYFWNVGIYPNNGDYLNGSIGDFLYFDQVLTPNDREIVECYLSSKYNLKLGHTCP
ncbi:LamG-like jellyroll fold domain-containing protein [Leptospira jelokensis]|uniref:LamG-like jellyroll fold domain-containing protein n=1 Tax=Leptospira jelokensis TaxID=2484931 RepID=UPI00109106F2|nr:LamG-like jellyroll fold domain-containing protein [Leptospira jelokensis]TGM05349.1 concanavalin [Leptospira jelokensis]